MAKIKTKYICQECGYETVKWLGRCPECGLYSTLVEEIIEKNESFLPLKTELRQPMTLKNIKNLDETRVNTGINELDRVLGGGIVTGSLTLVGGDPGIGKSTLLIQICQSIGEKGFISLVKNQYDK
jgi:DNA repair protein RadA/Sms